MPIPYILLTGLYCFLIFQNSAAPDPLPVEVTVPFNDKFAHAVMFGGLCALVSMGMSRPPRKVSFAALVVLPVLFTTAYGLTDEIHQLYVPQRSFELADLLADFLGACIAQTVLVLHWKRAWNRRPSEAANQTGKSATSDASQG